MRRFLLYRLCHVISAMHFWNCLKVFGLLAAKARLRWRGCPFWTFETTDRRGRLRDDAQRTVVANCVHVSAFRPPRATDEGVKLCLNFSDLVFEEKNQKDDSPLGREGSREATIRWWTFWTLFSTVEGN